ncbi:MAG: molybdopterin dinucleotide binding domain-containing protein, partial [Acidimicrobiales bacterium]
GKALRLVARRPMWDGGVLVQRSPSLAALHPPFAMALHPDDLAGLGADGASEVTASTSRGSVVVALVADPRVAPGTAVLPFNLPEGSAGSLIEASAPWSEVTLRPLEAQ